MECRCEDRLRRRPLGSSAGGLVHAGGVKQDGAGRLPRLCCGINPEAGGHCMGMPPGSPWEG